MVGGEEHMLKLCGAAEQAFDSSKVVHAIMQVVDFNTKCDNVAGVRAQPV